MADSSWWAAGGVGLVTLWYAFLGFKLYKDAGREMARKLMFGSFAYLPVVLFIILIDAVIL